MLAMSAHSYLEILMRVLLSLLSAVLLLACGTPADDSKEDDSANPGQSYRLMLPAQYATTQEPTVALHVNPDSHQLSRL
jgi:hypothetical protein